MLHWLIYCFLSHFHVVLFNLASYFTVVLTSSSSMSVAVPPVLGWPIPIHIVTKIKPFSRNLPLEICIALWALSREKDDDNADTFKRYLCGAGEVWFSPQHWHAAIIFPSKRVLGCLYEDTNQQLSTTQPDGYYITSVSILMIHFVTLFLCNKD